MNNSSRDLINYNRTWRTVKCINPNHSTVQFDTNQIGDIRCPMCESLMVNVVKSIIQMIRELRNDVD